MGKASPCEESKKRIEQKIMGTPFPEENLEFNLHDETDIRYVEEQRSLLAEMESGEDTTLGVWLKEIKDDVEITVQEDDGDRDNIMMNKDFAAHFLRLCKLLPLWSGISCNIFSSPTITSSSANVESYFKDVKLVLKDILPANADHFLHTHMNSIHDLIITASQKYAKLIDVNTIEITKGSEVQKSTQSPDSLLHDDDSVSQMEELFARTSFEEKDSTETPKNTGETDNNNVTSTNQNGSIGECIACSQGNFPIGAHTCIKCKKNVHIFPECSVAISEEEGFGTKRLCISCHMENRKTSQSHDTEAMNIREVWGPKKVKVRKAFILTQIQHSI